MAHNLTFNNGKAEIAFLGSRQDVWHHFGQEMTEGMTLDQWLEQAGLAWDAVKVPLYAEHNGKRIMFENAQANVRSDNGYPLGVVSENRYNNVQPRDVLAWFDRYIGVDSRFQLDVAGSLKGGRIIWATAKFTDDVTVAGDKHVARLLMTTSFDGTQATINRATLTRTVCWNTLTQALNDKEKALVVTRHSSQFDAAGVARELETIVQGFEQYKAMGEAMVGTRMTKEDISHVFKSVLDIPFEAKRDEISTRKMNQFEALNQAYLATLAEGTEPLTAWSTLNAVTRYVDHDRSGRGGDEGQFLSAQFGSGAAMKAKAVLLLSARVTGGAEKVCSDDVDVADMTDDQKKMVMGSFLAGVKMGVEVPR